MNGYGALAYFYDGLMEFDYGRLCDYYDACFAEFSRNAVHTVVDLACGTGRVTALLAERGYDMTAVDISNEMLDVAANSIPDSANVLLIHQDMCALDLNDTVDAAVCALDGINHLNSAVKLVQCFKSVHLFMNRGGVFVFDVHSHDKFFNVLSDNTFVLENDSALCVWRTQLSGRRICHYLDIFSQNRSGDNYRRFSDCFNEYWYSDTQIRNALRTAGFTLCKTDVEFDSERTLYIARKE